MRVAITLGGTDWGRSGLGTYVREVLPRLAGRLRSEGGSAVVIGDDREMDAYAGSLDGCERVRQPSLPGGPAASALWYLAWVGAVAQSARADVLLLPAANRRLSAWSPVPTVAVVHDVANLHVQGKYDPLRMAYLRWVMMGSLRSARQIVAVSKATGDDLKAAIGARPIRVVPNGVDAKRFAPRAADDPLVVGARQRAGLDRPTILYPSRLEHPGKNHLRLLGAFAASPLRDSHLLAFSGGDWGARGLIEAEIEKNRLRDSVRLLGFVASEDLPGLVAGADAVVMVGLHEGFGLPALEALAAGRAVCASSTGALPEVVGHLGALCDPLDEASIRAALERVVADKDLRARCGAEGPAWAAARGWDTTVEGLLEACRAAAVP